VTLNVNFAAMRQAAEDTRTCHNALVREKEGLDGFLTMLQNTWAGDASSLWQQGQKEWGDACDEVNRILLHLFNALEVAVGNYTETEKALERMWGG
jgi:WXG100 family type VII secretion target